MNRPLNVGKIAKVGVICLIVGLLVTAVVYAMLKPSGESSESAEATTTPSTAGATDHPSDNPSNTSTPNPRQTLLATQVSAFVQAYHRLEPQDTAATRQQRVSDTGLVTPEAMKQLSFGLATGTEADKARIRDGYTLVGTMLVNPKIGLSAKPIDDSDPNTVEVHVEVRVDKHWDGRDDELGEPVMTSSTWQYKPAEDTWILWAYSRGEDVP